MPVSTPFNAHEGDEGRGNHICSAHEGPEVFRERALRFLEDGLAEGQRPAYVGSRTEEALGRDIANAPTLLKEWERGGLVMCPLGDRLGEAGAVDPVTQVAVYAAETQTALDDGYSGLRVAVDATAAARTLEQRCALVRYEHLVDRFTVSHALSVLCGYCIRELGSSAVAEVACVHPPDSSEVSRFWWWAESAADVGLAGQIDLYSRDLFDTTLARIMPLLPSPVVYVDARALKFIDHHGLLALERHARHGGREVVLRTDSRVVRRLVELLDLQVVKVRRADG